MFIDPSALSELLSGEGDVKVFFTGNAKMNIAIEYYLEGTVRKQDKEVSSDIDLGWMIFSFEKGQLIKVSYNLPETSLDAEIASP